LTITGLSIAVAFLIGTIEIISLLAVRATSAAGVRRTVFGL